MATATVRAPQPGKRKARHVLADERAHTKYGNLDSATFTATALRLQLLTDRYGITPDRCALIAGLVFGEVGHV